MREPMTILDVAVVAGRAQVASMVQAAPIDGKGAIRVDFFSLDHERFASLSLGLASARALIGVIIRAADAADGG